MNRTLRVLRARLNVETEDHRMATLVYLVPDTIAAGLAQGRAQGVAVDRRGRRTVRWWPLAQLSSYHVEDLPEGHPLAGDRQLQPSDGVPWQPQDADNVLQAKRRHARATGEAA